MVPQTIAFAPSSPFIGHPSQSPCEDAPISGDIDIMAAIAVVARDPPAGATDRLIPAARKTASIKPKSCRTDQRCIARQTRAKLRRNQAGASATFGPHGKRQRCPPIS